MIGIENSPIPLNIDVALSDNDGSETLTVQVCDCDPEIGCDGLYYFVSLSFPQVVTFLLHFLRF